ncbi:MAG: permease [Spirochaetes bacterium]|nr:permease [Spirochaetota bacterium]
MIWKTEWKKLLWIVGIFLLLFYLPVGIPRFDNAVFEALYLVKWYAEEHVLLCLVPAFFIAGAIAVFVSQESVMKYLGPTANKAIAYGVSSVSGTILAVCSCTVLPLFSGIYRMGAGLGPATAFLYSGPAINVLAIVLTARVLGMEIGIARAVGAVVFSVVIGLAMHFIYRKEEVEKAKAAMNMPEPEVKRALWKNIIYFASMIVILVFANWGKPVETSGFWYVLYGYKWIITGASAVLFAAVLVLWFELKWWKVLIAVAPVAALAITVPSQPILAFSAGAIGLSVITSIDKGETGGWFASTWDFAKQILPLLLFGVLIAGFLLGRPGKEGVIPNEWVAWAVGGNSLGANFFAALSGAFMYFATLTEVPIVQGLIGSGMGKGPALALLLAGPALSLPSMLVIKSVIGWKKTIVYVTLVVIMATITGMIFGALF